MVVPRAAASCWTTRMEGLARLADERLRDIQQSLSLSHLKLDEIQHSLDHLHWIGSVGAAASVAGVSVAGFAAVLRRLDRLEHNLNEGMNRLRELERSARGCSEG